MSEDPKHDNLPVGTHIRFFDKVLGKENTGVIEQSNGYDYRVKRDDKGVLTQAYKEDVRGVVI